MIIGVPKEIKNNEYRVGLLPVHCEALVEAGHSVLVERRAGDGSGAFDADYRAAGARIASSPREIFKRADLIVQVKEPSLAAQPNRVHVFSLRRRQTPF
jgi:alanine dehydrogenase